MKICLVQSRPQKSEIPANSEVHRQWIERAAAHGADWVLFPELSLTGYEPTLAEELAMPLHDDRLDMFQELADRHHLSIGLGVPIRLEAGVCVGTVLFGPGQPRRLYAKQYLHADEELHFVAGQNASPLIAPGLALAICYELSVPEHSEKAAARGAAIYLASVAKSAAGIQESRARLAKIARTYTLTSLLVNCVGPSDNFVGAGQSFILSSRGELLGLLGEEEEGMLFFDSVTQEVTTVS
ncbi:MAG: carbon-nitrogen hydrolase family protein [Bacteroidetes bacterium]|nr:carbon-nitrogen hydrolase family protein [Bacteroidota bacterium]